MEIGKITNYNLHSASMRFSASAIDDLPSHNQAENRFKSWFKKHNLRTHLSWIYRCSAPANHRLLWRSQESRESQNRSEEAQRFVSSFIDPSALHMTDCWTAERQSNTENIQNLRQDISQACHISLRLLQESSAPTKRELFCSSLKLIVDRKIFERAERHAIGGGVDLRKPLFCLRTK